MGEYAQALIDRKRDLTEQLRRIDEAVDGWGTDSGPSPDALPIRGVPLEVEYEGAWYPVSTATDLVRAAIFECDQGLEDLGLLPAG